MQANVVTRRPDDTEQEKTAAVFIKNLTIRCKCSRDMVRSDLRKEPGRAVYSYLCKRCGNEIEIMAPEV